MVGLFVGMKLNRRLTNLIETIFWQQSKNAAGF
jgi:hypothetical protein